MDVFSEYKPDRRSFPSLNELCSHEFTKIPGSYSSFKMFLLPQRCQGRSFDLHSSSSLSFHDSNSFSQSELGNPSVHGENTSLTRQRQAFFPSSSVKSDRQLETQMKNGISTCDCLGRWALQGKHTSLYVLTSLNFVPESQGSSRWYLLV